MNVTKDLRGSSDAIPIVFILKDAISKILRFTRNCSRYFSVLSFQRQRPARQSAASSSAPAPGSTATDVAITGADTATAAVGIMAAAAMATTVAADTDADSIVAIAAETSTAATASVAVVTSAVAESSTAGTASTAAESPMVAAVSTAEAAALTAVATVVDDTKSPTTLRLERADDLVCRPFHFSLDSHNRISYTPIHINLCSSGRQLPLFCCPSAHFRC